MIKTGTGATKRITDDEVKEVLKINDDALQSVGPDFWVGRDLNDFWHCTTGGPKATVGPTTPTRVDINSFWTDSGFSVPAGYDNTRIITRRRFRYPLFSVYTKWVDYTDKYNDVTIRLLGQDHDGMAALVMFGCRDGHACFMVDSLISSWWKNLIVDSLMPSDYLTAKHFYTLKLNRNQGELYIDGALKGVALFGVPETLPTWENNPPYVLGASAGTPVAWASALIKVEREDSPPSAITFPIELRRGRMEHPVEVVDGDPLPARQFAIYTENSSTKWAGGAFDSAVTSHPVPVWGYPKKCFLFQSNAAGTIAIEVYAGGGWREVVSETVTANSLWDYVLNLEVPIARMKYTPAGSDTIAVAECNLS